MTILFDTLSNIITNRKETVYTLGQILYTVGLPAKHKKGVLSDGHSLPPRLF